MKKQLFWAFVVLMFFTTSCAMIKDFQEFRESKRAENGNVTETTSEQKEVEADDDVEDENTDHGVPAETLYVEEEEVEFYGNDSISRQDVNYEGLNGDIVEESGEMIEKIDDIGEISYFDGSPINTCNYPLGYVPSFDDEVYKRRFDTLRMTSTIDFVYRKEVKSFINVYAVTKRDKTARILGLAEYYFPIFEEYLDKYNLPLELKYLAVVESALNPTIESSASAKGLWQFMYSTGKIYGLIETTIYDDRFDPLKATDAACRHLKDLYDMFGDWNLALAAYNSGPGNVRKAIRRSGGINDYWAILPYLPKETRGYVPAFMAVNYVMRYHNEHNICPIDPGIILHGTDTVMVHDLLHFDQLNEMLNIPKEDLLFFNPQYKAEIIPATAQKPMVLRIPEKYVNDFIDHEKELYAFKTKKGIEKEKLAEKIRNMSDRGVHVVKKGETLSTIAKKYHVTVKQLKTWNNLKSDNLKIGQKLVVYSSGAPAKQSQQANSNTGSGKNESSKPSASSSPQQTEKIHVVKKGETLDKISKMYKCSIADLKKWNNLKTNTIKIGQKLKVYSSKKQSSNNSQSSSSSANSNSSGKIYTVKQGDSLWSIAKKHNVTVDYIKKKNNLKSNNLKVGQKLKL